MPTRVKHTKKYEIKNKSIYVCNENYRRDQRLKYRCKKRSDLNRRNLKSFNTLEECIFSEECGIPKFTPGRPKRPPSVRTSKNLIKIKNELLKKKTITFKKPWYQLNNNTINSTKEGTLTIINNFTAETRNSTFENYIIQNTKQEELLFLTKKFANKVSKHGKIRPILLFLTGKVGIGKTHLSVSIAKEVVKNGRNVIFINANEIYNITSIIVRKYKMGFDIEVHKYFNDLINKLDYDLIIIDDIQKEHDSAYRLCNNLFINHCIDKNISLLITANINLEYLLEQVGLEYRVNFNNYLLYDSDIDESLRIPWTDSIIGLDKTTLFQLLNGYDNPNQSSGIIIEESSIDKPNLLEDYEEDFTKISSKKLNVKLIKSLLLSNKRYTNNYYGNKLLGYDLVIERLYLNKDTRYTEIEHLIKLINQMHDKNIKLILIVPSIDILRQQLSEKLKVGVTMYRLRTYERIKLLLPGLISTTDINLINSNVKNSLQKRQTRIKGKKNIYTSLLNTIQKYKTTKVNVIQKINIFVKSKLENEKLLFLIGESHDREIADGISKQKLIIDNILKNINLTEENKKKILVYHELPQNLCKVQNKTNKLNTVCEYIIPYIKHYGIGVTLSKGVRNNSYNSSLVEQNKVFIKELNDIFEHQSYEYIICIFGGNHIKYLHDYYNNKTINGFTIKSSKYNSSNEDTLIKIIDFDKKKGIHSRTLNSLKNNPYFDFNDDNL